MLRSESGLLRGGREQVPRGNSWLERRRTREKGGVAEAAAEGSRAGDGAPAHATWGYRGLGEREGPCTPPCPLSPTHGDHSSGPCCPLPVTQALAALLPTPKAGPVPHNRKGCAPGAEEGRCRGPRCRRRGLGGEVLAPSGWLGHRVPPGECGFGLWWESVLRPLP